MAQQYNINININYITMSEIDSKIVFLLSNLGFQALLGQMGVYSIVKSPMAELFNYD